MEKRARKMVNYCELDDDLELEAQLQCVNFDSMDQEYDPRKKDLKRGQASSKKSAKQVVKKDETHMPFLKLAAELRNNIYELTLILPCDIDIKWATRTVSRRYSIPMWEAGRFAKKDMAPHLLRVCKQIYQEAAPLLYSQNHFSFQQPLALSGFFGRFPLRVRDLRNIKIRTTARLLKRDQGAFSFLSFAENLETVHIEVDCEYASSVGEMHDIFQDFYAALRNWLEVVGRRNGDKGAGMRILDVHFLRYSAYSDNFRATLDAFPRDLESRLRR